MFLFCSKHLVDKKCQEEFDLGSSLHWLGLRLKTGKSACRCQLGLARLHNSDCVIHLLTPVVGVLLGGEAEGQLFLGSVQVAEWD